jgi:hypothetical protein
MPAATTTDERRERLRRDREARAAQAARYEQLGARLSALAGAPLVCRQHGDAYSLHGRQPGYFWARGQCVPPTFDHGRCWYVKGRSNAAEARFLTSEPYQSLDDEAFLAAERAWADRLGLRLVEASADSPWNPGGTVLLVYERGPVRFTRQQLDQSADRADADVVD